jgi:integrator complex subunit 1
MLWNPDGPARKPPREVADLLLAVQEAFSLAHTFQRSVDPDFLLLTLGGTTRGAIERAYEWLIPVISQYPDTIARLPSSASCFLLLRAYGSDADERARLKALSAPLLDHVSGCLKGDLGKEDCVKAFDLLMADFASHKAERRRCARRVLHDSLQLPGVHKSWMIAILEVKYAEALVRDAINYMVRDNPTVSWLTCPKSFC